MKIEVRELMDENEMMALLFFNCVPKEKIIKIRDKFVGKKDWRKESVKIPVEMKIGGISVNPKEFFNAWKDQMQSLILEQSKELVAEKLGSAKIRKMIDKMYDYETILTAWESEINWEVKNPLLENK